MSEAAVAAFTRAIESQRAAEAELLARLEFAFVVSEADIAGGLPALEAVADEILERASEITSEAAVEASRRAERELVERVLEWGGGRARLREGWRDGLGDRLQFYAEQASERLGLARATFLAEIRGLLVEGEAFGWGAETVTAILVEDSRKRGRGFGAFRTAVRDAVASVAGQAWSETWLAAWASLEATT